MTTRIKPEKVTDYLSNLEELTAVAMLEYIEKTHHAYLKEIIPETQKLVTQIMEQYGRDHHELYDLHRIYNRLRVEVEQHLFKEEKILFPVIRDYGYHKTKKLYYEALNVLKGIEIELNDTDELIKQIKEITNNYTLPVDATPNHVRAYNNLAAIEEDLDQHVHLENDILFKKIQLGVYEEPKMA